MREMSSAQEVGETLRLVVKMLDKARRELSRVELRTRGDRSSLTNTHRSVVKDIDRCADAVKEALAELSARR